MKTPEEIKKGLTTCSSGEHGTECLECVYEDDCTAEGCYIPLSKDVLEYIRQLEEERDALKELLEDAREELEAERSAFNSIQGY